MLLQFTHFLPYPPTLFATPSRQRHTHQMSDDERSSSPDIKSDDEAPSHTAVRGKKRVSWSNNMSRTGQDRTDWGVRRTDYLQPRIADPDGENLELDAEGERA